MQEVAHAHAAPRGALRRREEPASWPPTAPTPTAASGSSCPIDDRLRAAARGDARRLTQIDVDLGTELPPRVIQARIRAGETPEQVAAASGTRVERIMRFAHPVLQERERVAEQAREARVRLTEGTPSVTLQQFMTERLRLIDTDIDAVTWDAHRSDDGTWLVTGAWRAGEKSGTTRWTFDLPVAHRRPVRRRDHGLRRGHPPGPRRPRRPGRAWPRRPRGRRGRVGRARRRPGRRRPRRTTPSRPTSCPSDLAAPRRRARPRRPRRRPAPRTTTARSTRCSTRSPSTTPSCSAAPARTARTRTPAPASRPGRTSSSGSAATADAPARRPPPAKLVRLGQYRRLASAAHGPAPARPRRRSRRPGPALRAAPAVCRSPARTAG